MITRRSFLGLLGVGAAAAVAPAIVLAEREPVRRFWQVGRNAPVGPGRYVWETSQDDRVRVSHRLMTMDPQANLITLKGNLTAADLERMRNANGAIVIPGDVEIEWVAPRFDWMAEHPKMLEWKHTFEQNAQRDAAGEYRFCSPRLVYPKETA